MYNNSTLLRLYTNPTKIRTPMYYLYNPSKNRVQKKPVSTVIVKSRSIFTPVYEKLTVWTLHVCLSLETQTALFGCTDSRELEEAASHRLESCHSLNKYNNELKKNKLASPTQVWITDFAKQTHFVSNLIGS